MKGAKKFSQPNPEKQTLALAVIGTPCPAEPGPGADGFQRPLVPRVHFQPQLRLSVRLP
jgi:hypothetical protein